MLTPSQDVIYLRTGRNRRAPVELTEGEFSSGFSGGHVAGLFVLFFPSRICQYRHRKHFHDRPNLGSIP